MLKLDLNKRYLLACSFGPDSMALFDMLLKGHYYFDVAHVNYHLRQESNEEQSQLERFCFENKVKLFVLDNLDVPKKNIEAECREIRYSFFKKLCDENGYNAVLVAHQQDDHIETYLLQKDRKNLVNYFGIKVKTTIKGIKVFRPLLGFTKTELLDHCNKNNVPYAIDITNLEAIYKRNKIRISVVSRMTASERANILKEIDKKNEELDNLLAKVANTSNKVKDILSLNDIELAYYLNSCTHEYCQDIGITYKQSIEVRKILESNKPNIIIYCCKGKVILEKAYSRLIVRANNGDEGYSFTVDKPQIIDNEYLYADLINDPNKRNIKENEYPLTIRSAHKGDKYKIKDYMVSVRRLFIDWKMPLYVRKVWPLIVNNEGTIVYIPRYQKDFVIESSPYFYVKERFTLK